MATFQHGLWRIGALFTALAALGGCAARASYVYEEPVVYHARPVYVAPPPAYYYHYHDHPVERRYYVAPRAYHVPVHRAPAHVYRAPAVHRRHHDWHHRDEHRHHH